MTAGSGSVLGRLAQNAAETPDRVCLVHGSRTVTWAELGDRVDRIASALRDERVERGARVILILENSPQFVSSYLGTLSAGAVAVPINPKAPAAVIGAVFDDCRPAAAFVEAGASPEVLGIASRPGVRVVYRVDRSDPAVEPVPIWIDGEARESSAPAPDPAHDGLALIVYTSGTTGVPKGVMLSHRNLRAIAAAGQHLFQSGPADLLGAVVPMFHLYGLREIDSAVCAGATLVIPRDAHFLAAVLGELHDHRVTGLASVPSALTILAERYPRELRACLEHLRYLAIGTAPTPPRLAAALRDLLPRTRLITTYGLTEASRVCWVDVTDPSSPADARIVGRAYAGVTLRLLDEVDGIGRVAVHSDMVMMGYWKRPEATRRLFTDDAYLLTPDCGRIDRDGTLRLLGRSDDVINCGGQKVSPDEVEEVLADHPGVSAVAVLGAPDPAGVLGQIVHAVIVGRPGWSPDAASLRAHAAARLEPYKVPARLEFVGSIPQSVLGKAQRARVRDLTRSAGDGSPAPALATASPVGVRRPGCDTE